MSTPPGSLDWQSSEQWRGPVLAGATVGVTSVSPFEVSEYVTSWASTWFGIQLNSGVGVTVTASWYTDSTLAIRMAQKQWILGPGNFINAVIFNLGNFLDVTISTGQAGMHNVFVTIAEQNLVPDVVTSVRGNAIINALGVNVNNAAQPQFVMPEVIDGLLKLMVTTSVTNANLGIFVDPIVESGAQGGHLIEATGNTVPQYFECIAITEPMALIVHNFTGAAITIDYAMQISVRS